ncbi:MAG: hypothetical protein ACI8VC_002018, partial [Candidatus Endobugula sp.]
CKMAFKSVGVILVMCSHSLLGYRFLLLAILPNHVLKTLTLYLYSGVDGGLLSIQTCYTLRYIFDFMFKRSGLNHFYMVAVF